MNNDAAAKIRMMKQSTCCLVLGLLGLLPLIGVLFALPALAFSVLARRLEKRFWNPAKPQRIFGLVCAALGLFLWGLVDGALICRIIASGI